MTDSEPMVTLSLKQFDEMRETIKADHQRVSECETRIAALNEQMLDISTTATERIEFWMDKVKQFVDVGYEKTDKPRSQCRHCSLSATTGHKKDCLWFTSKRELMNG